MKLQLVQDLRSAPVEAALTGAVFKAYLGMRYARGVGLCHGNLRCRFKQQHGMTSNTQGMQAWTSMLATFRIQRQMTT